MNVSVKDPTQRENIRAAFNQQTQKKIKTSPKWLQDKTERVCAEWKQSIYLNIDNIGYRQAIIPLLPAKR